MDKSDVSLGTALALIAGLVAFTLGLLTVSVSVQHYVMLGLTAFVTGVIGVVYLCNAVPVREGTSRYSLPRIVFAALVTGIAIAIVASFSAQDAGDGINAVMTVAGLFILPLAFRSLK